MSVVQETKQKACAKGYLQGVTFEAEKMGKFENTGRDIAVYKENKPHCNTDVR